MANSCVPYDGLIVTRKDAERCGADRFFTGKSCRQGHLSQRYVKSGRCIECLAIRSKRDYAQLSEEDKNQRVKSSKIQRERQRAANVRPCVHCGGNLPPMEINSKTGRLIFRTKYCSDFCVLFSKVNVAGPDDCWLFRNPQHWFGYGHVNVGPIGSMRVRSAHVVSWELHSGIDVPSGHSVCHKCDVPACVNPQHLFLGTQKDNNLDKTSKGRQTKGSDVTCAKLSPSDVLSIRQDTGSHTKLAKQYGVTEAAIRHVKNRKNWKHIP